MAPSLATAGETLILTGRGLHTALTTESKRLLQKVISSRDRKEQILESLYCVTYKLCIISSVVIGNACKALCLLKSNGR